MIAADRPASGELLGALFAERRHCIELVTSASPTVILAAARAHVPDVVVLDIELRRGASDGLRLIKRLRADGAQVVAFAAADAISLRAAYAEAAVDAIACRSEPIEHLLTLVERLLQSEVVLTREAHLDLVDSAASGSSEPCVFEALTATEKRILIQLLDGDSPSAIARENALSTATVRGHIQRILSKVGASSQLAVIAEAHRQGWPRPRSIAL